MIPTITSDCYQSAKVGASPDKDSPLTTLYLKKRKLPQLLSGKSKCAKYTHSPSLPKPLLTANGHELKVVTPTQVLSPIGRKEDEPAVNSMEELWPRSFIEVQRGKDNRAFTLCPHKWRNLYVIYLFLIVEEAGKNVKKGYIGRTCALPKRLSAHVSLINKLDSTTALAKAWKKGSRIFFGIMYSCKVDDRFCFEKMAQNETALIKYHFATGHSLANGNSGNGEGTNFGSPLGNGKGGFLSERIHHVLQMNSQLQVLSTEERLSPSKNAYGWIKVVFDKGTERWTPKEREFPLEWGKIQNGIYIAKTLDQSNKPTYYVGKTAKNLLRRIQQHGNKLNKGERSLYESARRTGTVYFGILGVTCSQRGLRDQERKLIRYYSSLGPVHNVQLGPVHLHPVSPLRQVPSPTSLERLSRANALLKFEY